MAGRENPLSAADTPPPVLQISSSEPEGPSHRAELGTSTWVSSPSIPNCSPFSLDAAEVWPNDIWTSNVSNPPIFMHNYPSSVPDILENLLNLPCPVWMRDAPSLPSNVGSASIPPQPPEIGELAKEVPTDCMEHSSVSNIYEGEIVPSEIQTSSAAPVNISEGNQEVNFQEPRLEMTFSSLEKGIEFYHEYAKKMGFKVRKGKGYPSKNGHITSKTLLCAKEGLKSKKQLAGVKRFTKPATRTGCKAMIKFSKKNGNWVVCKFISKHNHDLQCSTQKHDIDSCSKIPEANSLIQPIHEIGTEREAEAGGCARFSDMNYSKHLPTKKANHLPPDDSQGLLDFFKKLNAKNPSFFYALQVDAEGRITNFFWRDGISKIDYSYFSDFLTLDTTLRTTDRYNMICAPFWGLNHHNQRVFFGCALLLDESFESFAWLLGTFMEAMDRRQPKNFFTTECREISEAVEAILPKSQHRLCKELVSRNAKQYLVIHYKQPEFESRFHSCLFDCQSDLEFQSIWSSLLEPFHLHENLWLQNIYSLRTRRPYLFSKETCCAGMHSNQGSENFSHADLFQNMENQAMTLPDYVQKYEKAAEQQRTEELNENFCCSKSEPKLISSCLMEQQAAEVYTPTMFKIFQGEFIGILSAQFERIMSEDSIHTFKVTVIETEGQKTESMVEFNSLDSTIGCSCKMFESIGILCVHALRILNTQNIFEIPSQYILKRWTSVAKDGVVEDDNGEEIVDNSDRPLSLFKDKIMSKKADNVLKKGKEPL